MQAGQHGMTRNTLERIWLGAGTIHKGLTLTTGTTGGNAQFNFEKTLLCATSGGNSLEITSTLYDVPIDGVGIKVYGGVVKTGETGTMTINALDMTPELLNHALFSDLTDSQGAKDYLIGSTGQKIEEKHWIDNLAYVGETLKDRKPIVIIFEKAICTSGAKVDGKSFEASVLPLTFEAYRAYSDNDRMTGLNIRIYYPKTSADAQSAAASTTVAK
nr:MAG TPA: major tail protein [Caudoviricetes sp.]